MADQTPRINASHLERFSNKTIRMTGKVVQIRGDQATIDAAGQVNLQLNRESHLTVDHGVEIVGKVLNDLSIRVLMATDLGPDVDYAAAEAVVDATHRYREMFYDE